MRKLELNHVLVLCVLTIFLSFQAFAQGNYGALSYNKAVNISGKQRMLGQKICKAFLYLSENPNDMKVKKELNTSKLIFVKQHEILKKNAPSKSIKNKLDEVDEVWKYLSKKFDESPNVKYIEDVIKTNSLLLKQSDNVVLEIINQSKNNGLDDQENEEDLELKKIINISGKQRMLSQRLGLYYFANQGKSKSVNVERVLKSVYDELDDAIAVLLISSFNDARIEEALGEAMSIWSEFQENEKKLLNQGFDNAKVYAVTNTLTKTFNKITSFYERSRV